MVAVPAGTRFAAALAVVAAAVAGCAGPTASADATTVERCFETQGDAVGLAWSQTGRFLAVGTDQHAAQILDLEGDAVGSMVLEQEMVPTTVVSSADGHLAWISDGANGLQLTEDRAGGMQFTLLPDTMVGLGWTAIGFALLERPADGGSRVHLMDVDRPGDPNLIFQTDLTVERLWITADPEYLLLTVLHPDHRDAPATFEVVGPDARQHLEPPGADASGASMPSLRRSVVYRSAATSRMEAVDLSDPSVTITLTEQPALRGMVSDRGMLAFVPAAPANHVCLVDVASKLP